MENYDTDVLKHRKKQMIRSLKQILHELQQVERDENYQHLSKKINGLYPKIEEIANDIMLIEN